MFGLDDSASDRLDFLDTTELSDMCFDGRLLAMDTTGLEISVE